MSESDKADELIDDGYAALERGDLAEGRRVHAEAISAGANPLAAGLLEVDLLELEGLAEEALAAAEALNEAYPDEPAVALRHALVLLDVFDDVGEAMSLLRPLADAAPTDDEETEAIRHEATLSLIDCALATFDIDEALARAEALYGEAPDDDSVRVALCCARFEARDFVGARAILDEVLASDADASDAHFLSGRIYIAEGEIDKANGAFAKAARMSPGRFDTITPADESDIESALRVAIRALPEDLDGALDHVELEVVDGAPAAPHAPGAPLTLTVTRDECTKVTVHRYNLAVGTGDAGLDAVLAEELAVALARAFDLDIDDVTPAR